MLTRRSLIQGVLSLAALGPLARVAVAEEAESALDRYRRIRAQKEREWFDALARRCEERTYWVPDYEAARSRPGPRPGPTVTRAQILFGEWAELV